MSREHTTVFSQLAQFLSPERMQHSMGVMQVMDALAPVYGLDSDAANLAGLLHDAGKELPLERMLSIAEEIQLPLVHPADRDPLFLHGPISAYVAQREFHVDDPLVLEAIFRHSYLGSGAVQSPAFCWCLRFADMLEPGRDWQDLRDLLEPPAFVGKMGEAAHLMMDWLIPFLDRIQVAPHPSQQALRLKLADLFAGGGGSIPAAQIPV